MYHVWHVYMYNPIACHYTLNDRTHSRSLVSKQKRSRLVATRQTLSSVSVNSVRLEDKSIPLSDCVKKTRWMLSYRQHTVHTKGHHFWSWPTTPTLPTVTLGFPVFLLPQPTVSSVDKNNDVRFCLSKNASDVDYHIPPLVRSHDCTVG